MTEPPGPVFDLSRVGAKTPDGVSIVAAGHRLAYDLELAGYRTEQRLRDVITAIAAMAIDAGDSVYETVFTPGRDCGDRGKRHTKVVWLYQFAPNKAVIYYPEEDY